MSNTPSSTRRQFLGASAAAALGTAALSAGTSLVNRAHAAGSDVLKIGLIGCGGRGTGAATQALKADPNVKLTAMGDAFEDRLQISLKTLQNNSPELVDVPLERQFVGFDAYKKVIDSGVDVVLLATPPHFRPMHLEEAIRAGKHVFAEKPVAVDGPGVRRVLEICREAEQKNLSVVSGLCLRYCYAFQDIIGRIHDGEIGDVHTLQANDYRGPIWIKPREDDWTDMHWQMRNWYYFTWLSGDFNVEQHVHFLDICAWVKGDYPVSAVGMGGREVRKGEEYGNIYDHHSVVYEFADGAKLFSNTRQIKGCFGDMSAQAVGSKGRANINERIGRGGVHILRGGDKWTYEGEDNPFYQTEHNELFASIRSGKPINNGEYMAKSTLLAILGRMATYTGQKVTWDEALNSKEDLSPPAYEWGPIATPPIAVPGVTKVV
jgi:predicted dehydrogenase